MKVVKFMAIAFGIFSVVDLLFCHSRAGGNLDFQPFLDPRLRGNDNFGDKGNKIYQL
jgi:hypothetical protein